MSERKNEALGSPRTADSVAPRFLALSQPHHLTTVADVSESLFDCGDRIALLQQYISWPAHDLQTQMSGSGRPWRLESDDPTPDEEDLTGEWPDAPLSTDDVEYWIATLPEGSQDDPDQ